MGEKINAAAREIAEAKAASERERGKRIQQQWEAWIASEKGEQCLSGEASGEYLRNRLWWAFMAGADVR